jgi:hypothetical protein
MAGLRAEQIALYTKDMYKAEREGYTEEDVVYPEVYHVKRGNDVTGPGHKETQILGAGDLVRHEVEGQNVAFKSPVQGWQFFTKYWTFSDGLSLSKEAVEDTVKLGHLLRELAVTWGKSVRVLKERFASRVFNNGGTLAGDYVFDGSHEGNPDPSGALLYDGKPLFNLTGNARATKGGGTYYNSIASLTITPANFETLYNLMKSVNNRDERDRVIRLAVDAALTKPGADAFALQRIIQTPTQKGYPGTDLNDINVYFGLIKKHIQWDYLEGTGWYLGKAQHRDFQFHERQMSEIRFFRDEENLGYKASINVRFGVFIKNWRCWTRGNGASA